MLKKLRSTLPYLILLAFLSIISIVSRAFLSGNEHVLHEVDVQLFVLGSIMFVGYYINRIAPSTVIPSFVWAIFAGIALQPLLAIFTENLHGIAVVMELFGAIVLFAGGMEVPFKTFKQWFFAISSLALIGVLISSLGFAFGLYYLAQWFGVYEVALLPSLLILGAALSSTDPTAIIPTLKTLNLKRNFLKQVAIAETALTDVSGSILTNFFLLAFISAGALERTTILSYFTPLFDKAAYDTLALEIVTGIIVGYLGFYLIHRFYLASAKEGESEDPALLLSIPIFTFVLGNILAGAGFLATFVSGLFTDISGGMQKVRHFYDSFLDHLIKPFVFIILGALVPLETLIQLAPIGILCALLFMFVIRPFVVFVALLPWWWTHKLHLKDLLFLSFIRETGIIAAVLLVITAANDVIQGDFVIAIGMWVILLTLIIEPPLTPYYAKLIGITRNKK